MKHRKNLLLAATTVLLCGDTALLEGISWKDNSLESLLSLTLLFEFFRMVVGFGLLFTQWNSAKQKAVPQMFIGAPEYALPAAMYLLNDLLVFYMTGQVDTVAFLLLSNIRILITALMAHAYLGQRYRRTQWAALALLALGSATSQMVTCDNHVVSQITFHGLFLVVLHCAMSSAAGLQVEILMKRSFASNSEDLFYMRNVTLHLWSFVTNLALLLILSPHAPLREIPTLVHDNGIFLLMVLLLNHTLLGLAVSATLTYSDNLNRVFAHNLSGLVYLLSDMVVFFVIPPLQVVFGSLIVAISLYVYFAVDRSSRSSSNETLPVTHPPYSTLSVASAAAAALHRGSAEYSNTTDEDSEDADRSRPSPRGGISPRMLLLSDELDSHTNHSNSASSDDSDDNFPSPESQPDSPHVVPFNSSSRHRTGLLGSHHGTK